MWLRLLLSHDTENRTRTTLWLTHEEIQSNSDSNNYTEHKTDTNRDCKTDKKTSKTETTAETCIALDDTETDCKTDIDTETGSDIETEIYFVIDTDKKYCDWDCYQFLTLKMTVMRMTLRLAH